MDRALKLLVDQNIDITDPLELAKVSTGSGRPRFFNDTQMEAVKNDVHIRTIMGATIAKDDYKNYFLEQKLSYLLGDDGEIEQLLMSDIPTISENTARKLRKQICDVVLSTKKTQTGISSMILYQ